MIKLKRIDPDSNDNESGTKEDEPEITVDPKGGVSLKPKESEEEKEEKKIEASKPIETMVPSTPSAPVIASSPKAAPVAQNSTHEVVPVVEEVAKEVTTTDPSTGLAKKEIIKVPEVKNKVVAKTATTPLAAPLAPILTPSAAPVAQNSTHEVVPVVEQVEKVVTTKDSTTGEEKKEILKVPVTKNKVIAKPGLVAPAA